MKKILTFFLILLTFLNASAQEEENIKDFGKTLFQYVKESDTLQIKKIIPEKEELFEYMNLFQSNNQTKQEFIKEINENYETNIQKFILSLIDVKNKGENLGINWKKTKYEDTKIINYPDFKQNDIEAIDVIMTFSYFDVNYFLKTKCISLRNKIYIVSKIKLKTILE